MNGQQNIQGKSGSEIVRYYYYVENGKTTTWYVRDNSGNILSIYTDDNDNGDILPEEFPIYASSRIGTALADDAGNTSDYVYEITDHLGNVRATLGDDYFTNNTLLSYADYYPMGMVIPGREKVASHEYRFGYQGQFAEKDGETGYNQFEARLYDSRIGRWMVFDPAGQYHSPYLGMGNNWANGVDPDGALFNPIFDKDANLLGCDELGMQGEAIIMNKDDFVLGMSHEKALEVGTLASNFEWSSTKTHVLFLARFMTLSSRPDWDGVVTVSEAKKWRKKGNGQPLFVDISKMNFKSSGLSIYDYDKVGQTQIVNFFPGELKPFKKYNSIHRPAEWQLGRVYGELHVTLVGRDGTVVLAPREAGAIDRYNFILSEKGAFNFFGYGQGKIHTDSKFSFQKYNYP